jgi:hypothetical protein
MGSFPGSRTGLVLGRKVSERPAQKRARELRDKESQMKGRVRWSHVTIALALIAAVAIAAPAVGGSSATTAVTVSKKTLKKLIKKEVAKQVAKATGPAGPPGPQGQQGLQGQSGQDATNLFAYIRDPQPVDTSDAVVEYGSGVTAVSESAGVGSYRVTFNRSLENCVVQAVPGSGRPSGPTAITASSPIVQMTAGDANQVALTWLNTASGLSDTAFLITAFC